MMKSPQSQHQQRLAEALELYRAGRLGAARDELETLRRARPTDAEVLHLLGATELKLGHVDRAVEVLTRAASEKKQSAPILSKLAVALVASGRFDDAASRYDEAMRAEPAYGPARWGMAELLERMNRLDDARALLESWSAAEPDRAHVAVVLAGLELKMGRPDEAIRHARAGVASFAATPDTLRQLWRLLGRALEQTADIDGAFEAYQRANDASPVHFDAEALDRHVDALLRAFEKKRWPSLARSGVQTRRHVFVLGFPRCGSTLVEQMLSMLPGVHAAGESPAFPGTVGLIRPAAGGAAYPQCVGELSPKALARLARTYQQQVGVGAGDAIRIVDKMLNNTFNVGLIGLMLPEASIIHVRRAAMDTCLSCFTSLVPHAHTYAANLTNLGRAYRAYERLMSHWRTLPNLRMIDIRYEDLVADPARTGKAMCEHCGVAWDDRCLRFHESTRTVTTASIEQVRKPLYRDSVDRHARFGRHLAPLRQVLGLPEAPATGGLGANAP